MSGPDLELLGEALAEQGLVVRLLEDGALTVTHDDDQPDQARMVVAGVGDQLQASLRLIPLTTEPSPELEQTIDEARAQLGDSRLSLVVTESEIRLAGTIGSTAVPEVQELLGLVQSKAANQRAVLVSSLAGPQKLMHSDEALPPSYLKGKGQRTSEETLTHRYGSLEATPGRGEVPQRAPTRAHKKPRPPSQGGGGAAVAVVAIVGLLAVAGGGALALGVIPLGGGGGDGPAPLPSSPAAASPTPVAVDDGGMEDDVPTTPAPTPVETLPPEPERPGLPSDVDGLLAALAADPDQVETLLDRWRELGLSDQPGARQRLLGALHQHFGHNYEVSPTAVNGFVLDSLEARPPDFDEACELFDKVAPVAQRTLVRQLAGMRSRRDEVVAFLRARLDQDSPDRIIDEALLELGAPEPETLSRLIEARGADWVSFGVGREQLVACAQREPKLVAPLLKNPSPELRAAVCKILGDVDAPAVREEVLNLLVGRGALVDPEPAVRRQAASALRRQKNPRAAWALALALLREQDDRARGAVSEALLELPRPKTLALLERLAVSKKVEHRRAAVTAFESLGSATAVEALLGRLGDQDAEVRREALEALRALTKRDRALKANVRQGTARLRELALNDPDPEVKKAARQLHLDVTGSLPRR